MPDDDGRGHTPAQNESPPAVEPGEAASADGANDVIVMEPVLLQAEPAPAVAAAEPAADAAEPAVAAGEPAVAATEPAAERAAEADAEPLPDPDPEPLDLQSERPTLPDGIAAPPGPMPGEGFAFSRTRRPKPWWEDLFTDEWMRVMQPEPDAQVERQVDFVEQSLGVSRGGWVLDVGCGVGRHAVRFAGRGYQTVGVDLSLSMLARCSDEAQAVGQKLSFLQCDMRQMTFRDTFDGAYCIGTTFGYFEDDQNVETIAGMHRALKPKGLLFLEVANRDRVVRTLPNLVWYEGDGCTCMEETSFNQISSRMHVRRTMVLGDGTQRTGEHSIRLYSLHELGALLHASGFRVAEVSGSYATPGAFFAGESPSIMVLAEKRPPSRNTSGAPTLRPPARGLTAGPTVPSAPSSLRSISPPPPPTVERGSARVDRVSEPEEELDVPEHTDDEPTEPK